MSKRTKNLNSISNRYAGLVNTDTNRNTIIKMAIAFVGLQIVGIGIDAAQATMLTQDSFKTAWKNIRSDSLGKWVNIGIVVSLIILLIHIIEASASSHEAKRFAELTIKRYARKFNINISNLKIQDFRDIAELVLSHMPDQDKTQILKNCAVLREELYVAEMQRLKNEITAKQYNKICKVCLVEMTNYIVPIIQKTMAANPALGELIQNIINGKTKYIPTKMFTTRQK